MALATLSLVWQYWRFILGSVAREFRSRYTRTIFGAAGLLLAPFAMNLILSIKSNRRDLCLESLWAGIFLAVALYALEADRDQFE